MRIRQMAVSAFVAASIAASAAAQEMPAPARALFTIANADCVSVDADGDPWLECGIQAFDMTEDATRILTVSTGGTVQLWNDTGRELQRLAWADQPGGASGYPNGHAAIVGAYGVAVVHQNQIVVLDLASGKILSQRVADAMLIEAIARFGARRALVGFRVWDWRGTYAAELLLPSGELSRVADLDTLQGVGPGYRIGGKRAPFTLHDAESNAATALARSCAPIDARFCVSWKRPEAKVHVFDRAQAAWRSYGLGRKMTDYDSVDVVLADSAWFAIVCGRGNNAFPPLRPCAVRDLERQRNIHRFDANRVRADWGIGPRGAPELRLSISNGAQGELRAVALDGTTRTLAASGEPALGMPNGGSLIAADAPDASILLDRSARKLARLPFAPQTCGAFGGSCRVSGDGRHWLVASSAVAVGHPDDNVKLTLYALP